MTFKALLLTATALLAVTACSKSAHSPKTGDAVTAAAGTFTVAPLKFTHRKLANGLDVYALPDASTANVSVQVWYRVGSKDDPKDRSGFAHLFEHIMFKSTRNMPEEYFDRLTEDVGGFNNASTNDDFTNYFEVVPANHLQRLLWAEAERMGSLVVDDKVFNSERDVVKEELRQRVLADPYGRLFYLYLNQANYAVHPYGRPGIGSIEDLDAATVDDVRAFHATYYRPDNAVLVVSGNFTEADLDKWVDQYFGPLKTPSRPVPRVTVAEPARTAPKVLTTYAPNVSLPAVAISYPGLAATSPDYATLVVLDAILARGDSSRLHHSLIYTQRIAAEAFTFSEATQDPSIYSVLTILSEGKTPDEGLAALKAEIGKLRDAPVTAAELDKAKNELLTAKLEDRETAFGRASEIADSVIRFGDPAAGDKLLAGIQKTSAADIQRLAKALFDDNKSVSIKYLSDADKPKGAAGDVIATSKSIDAAPLAAAADAPRFTLAPEAERVAPPAPAAPVSAQIPATQEKTLANGLRVIVATNAALPLISANLRFDAGAAADPGAMAGLADLTATLATKGTKTRSATEIAQQIEALGASLDASAGADSTAVSLFTRADRKDEAFTLFADVTRNPVFAKEELDRARQQALDELSVALSNPGQIAGRVMTRLLYGASPYGGVATERSLDAIAPDDTVKFHDAYWRPDDGVLVIAGAVTAEEGFALAEKYFGDWTATTAASAPAAASEPGVFPAKPRTVVVDLPGTGQAAVSYGVRAVTRTSADYFPTLVATTVLGGGYSARLNTEIRIKRGLSYGAGAGLPSRKIAAPIVARTQTKNATAVQVADIIGDELKKIGAAAPSADELTARKASITGGFGRDIETISGLSGDISTFALFGIPVEKLSSYVTDVDAVSPDAVRAAAAKYFDPKGASIVVVGDAKTFWKDFKAKYPEAERLTVKELDLDKPALK